MKELDVTRTNPYIVQIIVAAVLVAGQIGVAGLWFGINTTLSKIEGDITEIKQDQALAREERKQTNEELADFEKSVIADIVTRAEWERERERVQDRFSVFAERLREIEQK